MRLQERLIGIIVLLLCVIAGVSTMTSAQGRAQRDPLGFLKRAITEANAPALTSDQETQLNTLITNFRAAQPSSPNEELKAAHEAYNSAVLSGDLATAQAQATVIARLTADLSSARLQTLAKFQVDVLALLKSGGQLDPLKEKFGDRLLGVIGSLAGGPPFGGRQRGGPGGGPGFPPPPPEGAGQN
jgi:Spy/CpxP family protein refolding chaperone